MIPSTPSVAAVQRVARYASRRLKAALAPGWAFLRYRQRHPGLANPYRILFLSPACVTRRLSGRLEPAPVPGSVIDGDWDNSAIPFRDTLKYRGLTEHFVDGVPWRDTVLFQEHYRIRLETSERVLGMTSLDALCAHYQKTVDPLFAEIRNRGLRPPSLWNTIDPIDVHLGRSGCAILGMGGNHRVAMAQILDVPQIPVRVGCRHLHWQILRDQISKQKDPVFVPVELREHPDLRDLLRPG